MATINELLYESIPPNKRGFSINFMEEDTRYNLPPHWHEHLELTYICGGKCEYKVNNKSIPSEKGDLLFVNANELHYYECTHVNYLCLQISPNFFSDVKFENVLIQNSIHHDEIVDECMRNIRIEYMKMKDGIDGSDMMLKSHTYRLMAHLLRNYKEASISTKKSYNSHITKLNRCNLILTYIADHYNEKITTAQLAKLCHLNESYFCRFFRSMTGKAITEYINEYRVEKAASMLVNTNESVTRIALESGFDDANYFSKIFKRIKKTSPIDFRKNPELIPLNQTNSD